MQVPVVRAPEESSRPKDVEDSRMELVFDATVLTLCNYDSLMRRVDLKKVKEILRREMERVGAGPMHLTPLFIYLHAIARPWFVTGDATACTREIAAALEDKGLRARLPDGLRASPAGRDEAGEPERSRRTPLARRAPVGTSASMGRSRSPRPTMHR